VHPKLGVEQLLHDNHPSKNMISGTVLLAIVTFLYAGYNIFVKLSGGHVPASATTTVLATICLQLAALFVSLIFLGVLAYRGGHEFSLSPAAYSWAIVAGFCIGAAEIGYFYLFGGIGDSEPMRASLAIPAIVSGTIVISLVLSVLVLQESADRMQLFGSTLIVLGIVVLFLKDGPGT